MTYFALGSYASKTKSYPVVVILDRRMTVRRMEAELDLTESVLNKNYFILEGLFLSHLGSSIKMSSYVISFFGPRPPHHRHGTTVFGPLSKVFGSLCVMLFHNRLLCRSSGQTFFVKKLFPNKPNPNPNTHAV